LFQTCSDENILNNSFYSPSIFSEELTPSQGLNDNFDLSLEELTKKKKIAIQNFLDTKDDLTLNSYDVITNYFSDFSWGFLPFVIAFFLILIAIVLSFTNKSRLMFILCLISFVLIIIELALFYFSKFLEDYKQIKIGYYFIIVILLFSIRESYKDWKRNVR